MYEIGFEEYLYGEGVCVVEWGDMVEELLPKNKIYIYIKKLEDNEREIQIKGLEGEI
ncbi:tRNA (adenosine(37)-N6)-threonylcarbamoyltransferase complex ATPase subunit type 1 TsaE [Caloramator sp. mosi_1]|uniref:tRNA (adenosine(37)-N6)-threonylcarbamoyltransferase complex ATPase subunit type 1 TsaE n=1 Tax=Caloramator sp. mosi_1 TaxID=3023090 RepID=UPI003082023D